ncbi:MAG: RNA-binding cell elongation regulator Jag/EloR [Pseudomonadota bacterium]
MPVIEFEGKTTEEALEKARAQLRLPPDELKFEIISTGSSGIFGLGGKKARIRVTIEEKTKVPPAAAPTLAPAPAPKPAFEPRESIPEPPRRSRENARPENRDAGPSAREGSRGPREDRPRPEKPRPERPRPRGPRPEQRRPETPEEFPRETEEEPAAPIFTGAGAPLPPTQAGPGEKVYEGPEDEIMTKARESLAGILNRMSLEAAVVVQRIEDRVILTISGDNSGLLIGKKGATLDALQFLVNKIVNRDNEDKNRVIVDSENYRLRRHQSLVDLAVRMAEKAQRNRRPVTISQLSAHDRRVVHLALQEQTGLRTRSRGDGPLKNVVIIPGSKKPGRPSQPRRPRNEDLPDEVRTDAEETEAGVVETPSE